MPPTRPKTKAPRPYMLIAAFLLAVSILLLWKGADSLVESASRIGRRLGMSDLVVGATIVALGTSAPELAVGVTAAMTGRADLCLGNVVGSNTFNLGFVLGGCALVAPLRVARAAVERDGLLVLGSAVVLLLMVADLRLSHLEGGVLLAGLVTYLVTLVRRRSKSLVGAGVHQLAPDRPLQRSTPRVRRGDWLMLPLALAAVACGGQLLVESASWMARSLGVSEWVIAVTIVAAGTSAPEMATSLVAAAKGRHSMSIGNLLGSDLFNILGVLGLTGLVATLRVSPAALPSVAMMVGMCVVAVLFLRTGFRLSRLEGLALISIGATRWALDAL